MFIIGLQPNMAMSSIEQDSNSNVSSALAAEVLNRKGEY